MPIIFQQGMSQQTPAVQSLLRGVAGRSGKAPRRKRSGASKSTGSKKRRASSKSSRKASKAKRFVKGSAEAKRHMAKLRRMRKK